MGLGKFPLGTPYSMWRVTKKMILNRRAKREKFIKDLKNPKFRAKAKLKDYKIVL